MPSVVNMPTGIDFLPALARGLDNLFGEELLSGLILLPTRRAIRDLSDAFTLYADGAGDGSEVRASARLLPSMRPLADIDPDEPPFEPGDLASRVFPAISGLQRRFELSRLVRQYYEKISDQELSPAVALTLADPLLRILDDVAMEGTGEFNLQELEKISDKAAVHFQTAAEFYHIIQDFWPKHLSEMKRLDPMARRVALLDALTDQWTQDPPDFPVIIAGSTGTLPATTRLMRCVKNLPKGLIVLPGLSTTMRATAWETVKEDHPQYSMKLLLGELETDFSQVDNFLDVAGVRSEIEAKINATALRARRAVISESLVPVEATEEWLSRINLIRKDFDTGDAFDLARDNFSLIEAEDDEEEALSIAVIMRESLETAGQMTTLVTPDPALARRVKSRLRRWGVVLDSSAGEPLEETPLGAFLSHCLRLVSDPYNPLYLSGLMASPFAQFGREHGQARARWLPFETQHLRGVRKSESELKALPELIDIMSACEALLALGGSHSALTWTQALTQVAETIAARVKDGELISGAAILWRGEAGEIAATLLRHIMAYGNILGDFTLAEFQEFFGVLMRGQVVRPRFGTHPQLRILGPLEARMLSSDVTILGGLNEGLWPASPNHDPFLSRDMRRALRLTLPERRYGLSAHDFEGLAMGARVILTRSKRSDGTPMVASRWLWRLKTLFNGAYSGNPELASLDDIAAHMLRPRTPYLEWARALDYVAPADVKIAAMPNPKPDIEARWPLRSGDEISVTKFKTWIRDPYAVYAQQILKLEPLEDLDMPLGPREFGNALHKAVEILLGRDLSDNIDLEVKRLYTAFRDCLRRVGFTDLDFVREDVRLKALAEAVIADFHHRGKTGYKNMSGETKGTLTLDKLGITLTGYPDRIDLGPNGYEIIDFKTGDPPGKQEVIVGFDPQLPLLALMVEAGAFDNVKKGHVDELSYKRLRSTGGGYETRSVIERGGKKKEPFLSEDHIAQAKDTMEKLVAQARDKDTGYPSQIRRKWANKYGEYDQLARREEWAQLTEDKGGE